MRVLSIRFARKFNLENYGLPKYETEDIAVELAAEPGQTADELLAEARAFVMAHTPGQAKPSAAPPFANGNGKPVSPPTAEPSANGNSKRGKGRPPKAFTEAKKAVDLAKSAMTLEALLEGFNGARAKAHAFTVDEWEVACGELGAVYKRLNSVEANPETVTALVNAFKAERTAIDTKRQGSA